MLLSPADVARLIPYTDLAKEQEKQKLTRKRLGLEYTWGSKFVRDFESRSLDLSGCFAMSLNMPFFRLPPAPAQMIDPRTNEWLWMWDIVTAISLIFVALGTPMEVGFLDPTTRWLDPLFITNQCINLIFIIDLVLQFFLMVRRPSTHTHAQQRPLHRGLQTPPIYDPTRHRT